VSRRSARAPLACLFGGSGRKPVEGPATLVHVCQCALIEQPASEQSTHTGTHARALLAGCSLLASALFWRQTREGTPLPRPWAERPAPLLPHCWPGLVERQRGAQAAHRPCVGRQLRLVASSGRWARSAVRRLTWALSSTVQVQPSGAVVAPRRSLTTS
jgi:hypothetical protein